MHIQVTVLQTMAYREGVQGSRCRAHAWYLQRRDLHVLAGQLLLAAQHLLPLLLQPALDLRATATQVPKHAADTAALCTVRPIELGFLHQSPCLSALKFLPAAQLQAVDLAPMAVASVLTAAVGREGRLVSTQR